MGDSLSHYLLRLTISNLRMDSAFRFLDGLSFLSDRRAKLPSDSQRNLANLSHAFLRQSLSDVSSFTIRLQLISVSNIFQPGLKLTSLSKIPILTPFLVPLLIPLRATMKRTTTRMRIMWEAMGMMVLPENIDLAFKSGWTLAKSLNYYLHFGRESIPP